MIKIEKVVQGVSEYLKARLYPSLDSGNRMKITGALYIAKHNPQGVISLLLAHLMPNTPPEKAIAYVAALGILDGAGNIDVDLLLGLAKNHIEEFGELSVNLFGVEFDLNAANVTTLGKYIKAVRD